MKKVALFCLVAAILLTVLTVFVFAVYGDLNGDSEIDAKDAVRLSQYLAKWDIDFTAEDEKNADVFFDGVINVADAVKLAQYLAGWNVKLGLNDGDVEVDAGDLFDETTAPEEPPLEPDPLFRVIDGVKYYDVRAAGARGSAYSTDDSAYFIEGVEGYYIDELTFLLDADTIWRIVDVPCTGTGAVNYIHELRISKAAVLLATTGLSVAEIAEQVGFGDAAYFSRVFRKSCGRSPVEYRREGQKE